MRGVGPASGDLARRYAAASAVTVVAGQAVLFGLFAVAGFPRRPAYVSAYVTSTGLSYVLNRRWVWGRSGRSHVGREILPFVVIAVVTLALSTWAAEAAESLVRRSTHSRWVRAAALSIGSTAVIGVVWVLRFFLVDGIFGAAADHRRKA